MAEAMAGRGARRAARPPCRAHPQRRHAQASSPTTGMPVL